MQQDRRKCVRVFIIITLLGTICISGCGSKEAKDTVKLREVEAGQNVQKTEKEAQEVQKAQETRSAEAEVVVHVCGQVLNPGVYRLKGGSRIYEALEAAGGTLESAADEALNQAETVADGQQIYVPEKGEAASEALQAEGMEAGVSADSRVNINTATREELMTLNGIGTSRADSIIRYREERGGFTSIEELKEIEGIKDGIFNKIKDQVKAG